MCYLICLSHLVRSRAFTNLILVSENNLIYFMGAQYVLSYHLIQVLPAPGIVVHTTDVI